LVPILMSELSSKTYSICVIIPSTSETKFQTHIKER
jgi:hypothetical protein